MSAPRSRIRSRPARRRSQHFGMAATHALRLLISRAVVPAETVSWSSRIREQTLAFVVFRLGSDPAEVYVPPSLSAGIAATIDVAAIARSEEHTSELQSLR